MTLKQTKLQQTHKNQEHKTTTLNKQAKKNNQQQKTININK